MKKYNIQNRSQKKLSFLFTFKPIPGTKDGPLKCFIRMTIARHLMFWVMANLYSNNCIASLLIARHSIIHS